MADDIVQRLHAESVQASDDDVAELVTEAADEIERLRADVGALGAALVRWAEKVGRLTPPPGVWRVTVHDDGTVERVAMEPIMYRCAWVNPISGGPCSVWHCDGMHYVGGEYRNHLAEPTEWADVPVAPEDGARG